MIKNNDIADIFKHWNASGIIIHKVLDKRMESVVESVLKDGYEKEDLLEAITLYAQILKDPASTWTYKWRIEEFFKRVPGFRHFLKESDPLTKFYRAGNSYGAGSTTPPVLPVSPALREEFIEKKKALQILRKKKNETSTD